jgi:hypothetical protein
MIKLWLEQLGSVLQNALFFIQLINGLEMRGIEVQSSNTVPLACKVSTLPFERLPLTSIHLNYFVIYYFTTRIFLYLCLLGKPLYSTVTKKTL